MILESLWGTSYNWLKSKVAELNNEKSSYGSILRIQGEEGYVFIALTLKIYSTNTNEMIYQSTVTHMRESYVDNSKSCRTRSCPHQDIFVSGIRLEI